MGAALRTTDPSAARHGPSLGGKIRVVAALVFGLPVAVGLIGTIGPAFGYLPAIGLNGPSLEGWRTLAATPGISSSIAEAVAIAGASWAISLVLACSLVGFATVRRWRGLQRLNAVLLAVPHAALAIGLAFLLAPSGLVARLIATLLGAESPGSLSPLPPGLLLLFALVLKETPFLALMLASAQASQPTAARLILARSLGHPPLAAWWLTVLPTLIPALRLPSAAVIAFAVAPVDLALIFSLAPSPHLSVQVTDWLLDPRLNGWSTGAAGACTVLILALALSALTLWALEWLALLLRRSAVSGPPGPPWLLGIAAAVPAGLVAGLVAMAAISMLPLWSVAGRWRFPDVLPQSVNLGTWAQGGAGLIDALSGTVLVAAISTFLALALVIVWLEGTAGRRTDDRLVTALVFLPLLLPQLGLMFGLQVALVSLGIDGTLASVVGAHLLFVVPYVLLSLQSPYRALDPRWTAVARSIGHGRVSTFFRVKLRLLAPSLATAAAVGVAVSASLYLPTLFAGAGRVSTLALEAVALAHSDRRSAAAVGTLLALVPLAAFLAAAMMRERTQRR